MHCIYLETPPSCLTCLAHAVVSTLFKKDKKRGRRKKGREEGKEKEGIGKERKRETRGKGKEGKRGRKKREKKEGGRSCEVVKESPPM